MAHAGVGLIVSFRNKSIIRLLHMETFECITEINTSAVVTEMLDGEIMFIFLAVNNFAYYLNGMFQFV